MASSLKINFFFIVIWFLIVCCNANAGYQHNSILGGRDYCLDVSDQSGTVANTRCKPVKVEDGSLVDNTTFFLLKAGAANGVSVSMATSDTTVDTSFTYIKKAISSDPAFQTGTLPDGQKGKLLIIEITELQAEGATWTLTPTTSTEISSIVFNNVGDKVELLYLDDTFGWVMVGDDRVIDIQVNCDASSGDQTFNLPALSDSLGETYNIKKIDSSVNTCTVDGDGSETIDGDTTAIIELQYESITVRNNIDNWLII